MRVQVRGLFDRDHALTPRLAVNLRRALGCLLASVSIQAKGRTADARIPEQMCGLRLSHGEPFLVVAEGDDCTAAASLTVNVLGSPQSEGAPPLMR